MNTSTSPHELSHILCSVSAPNELLDILDGFSRNNVTLYDGDQSFPPLPIPSAPVKLPSTQKDREILSMYMQEMQTLPSMTDAEQLDAFLSEDKSLLTQVVEANLFLVPLLAERYVENMNTDILQEANFEILSAASDYDYKNAPYPFSIYAAFRIHRAFLSAISDFTELMHGSEVIREKCNDIARERKRLQDSGDSDPDISQIASAAGCNVEFAHAVLSQIAESEGRDQKPLSQYEQDSEAKNAPEPEAAVQKLLDKLNETERRVISLRYGLSGKPLSADETAAKLSLTADEVKEIEQNALIHLRTL